MSTLFKGLERIEEARERFTGESFMAGLYDGRPDFDLLLPPPEPPEEKDAGEAFCRQVEAFLIREVDPGGNRTDGEDSRSRHPGAVQAGSVRDEDSNSNTAGSVSPIRITAAC